MTHLMDPDAVLDWCFDWSPWLDENEAIVGTPVVTVERITLDRPPVVDEGRVTVWLRDGEVATTARATCRIVTDQGRTDERTLSIRITQR